MKDDRGALMLLTAVILIIGFVALAGMTARTSQIPERIEAERMNAFQYEAEAVGRYVDALLDPTWADCTVAEGALAGAMDTLEVHLRSRGIAFSWSCNEPSPPATAIALWLSDGKAQVRMVL